MFVVKRRREILRFVREVKCNIYVGAVRGLDADVFSLGFFDGFPVHVQPALVYVVVHLQVLLPGRVHGVECHDFKQLALHRAKNCEIILTVARYSRHDDVQVYLYVRAPRRVHEQFLRDFGEQEVHGLDAEQRGYNYDADYRY